MVVKRETIVVLDIIGIMLKITRDMYTTGISTPYSEVLVVAENWLGGVLQVIKDGDMLRLGRLVIVNKGLTAG
jgi:hypothetical protein